jgi:hypothetical protein
MEHGHANGIYLDEERITEWLALLNMVASRICWFRQRLLGCMSHC